ncbi:MAG: hypothetical protein HFI14_09070 [Lachnospiraceae bacterium]|nr:hypothetical protein [Lachnospiraceae bacterium]
MLQEVVQEIENVTMDVLKGIHTAMPGVIASFDPGSGRATIKPNGKYMSSSGKRMAYPQLSDVPVAFPICQSAGVGIAYPVKAGDSCIIIVSEVELDEWRSGAESEGSLRFDLSSAMAVPGLLVGGSEMIQKACAQEAVVIVSGTAEVLVSEDQITASVGNTEFKVSEAEIAIRGDLKVDGDISYTGSIHEG